MRICQIFSQNAVRDFARSSDLPKHTKGNFSWFLNEHILIIVEQRIASRGLDMKEAFEKLAAMGSISPNQVNALVKLAECKYCTHKSWGFGKITTIDTVLSRFLIDFKNKKEHSMALDFGAKTLTPLPADHILVRKEKDLPSLRRMAALNHIELIRLVIESFGGEAKTSKIQEVLVPDVIADDWRKWWEGVRKELKKDGHFSVPIKKNEPILYNAEAVSLEDRLLRDLKAARGLKARLVLANEILRNREEIADKSVLFKEACALLNEEISKQQKDHPHQSALALEGIFARDDLCKLGGFEASPEQIEASKFWKDQEKIEAVADSKKIERVRITELFKQLPANRVKRALASFQKAFPKKWESIVLEMMNWVGARLVGEFARVLMNSKPKQVKSLKAKLVELINQHQASSELLLWLVKSRSDSFADILDHEVFRAMITAMEKEHFDSKKSSRLNDFLMNDKALLPELIQRSDLEVVKDLTRALQHASCFEDMDKRSLLARIVKSYPAVQSLISGEQETREKGLLVSWKSLERRRAEYETLVRKQIPANSKEIAVARSYGDLRENHEYKAAKEAQKLLMTRKAELESEIALARGTDFSDASSASVSIGTIVSVTDQSQNTEEDFTILGAWDSDPDKGFISYLSPIAQELLGHKPGEAITLAQHGGKKYLVNRIEKIPAKLAADLAGVSKSLSESSSDSETSPTQSTHV